MGKNYYGKLRPNKVSEIILSFMNEKEYGYAYKEVVISVLKDVALELHKINIKELDTTQFYDNRLIPKRDLDVIFGYGTEKKVRTVSGTNIMSYTNYGGYS